MTDIPTPGQAKPPLPRTATPAEVGLSPSYDFGFQAIMEMQKSIGGLIEAVNGLKSTVEDQGKSIGAIKRTIHIATGFLVCLGLVGGGLLALIAWLVDTGFDRLVENLAK